MKRVVLLLLCLVGFRASAAENWVIVAQSTGVINGSNFTLQIYQDTLFPDQTPGYGPGWENGQYSRFRVNIGASAPNAGYIVRYLAQKGANNVWFGEAPASGVSSPDIVLAGVDIRWLVQTNLVAGNPNAGWTDLTEAVKWTAGSGPQSGKKLVWKLPATGEVPVTWQLVETATGDVVGVYQKGANTPEYAWSVGGLPSDAERGDYALKFFLPALKFDTEGGTWVTVSDPGDGTPGDATVFDSTVPNTGPGAGVIINEDDTPDPDQIGIVPTPPQVPSVPPQAPGAGGVVWRAPGGTGGLSDAVYKEGVDKLISAIEGSGPTTRATFDQTAPAGPEYQTSMGKAAVDGILSKVPSAPEVTMPQASTGVFSFDFVPPGTSTAQTFTMDLTPWETQINVFKLLIRAGLALWFFFLVVRALKEAFAS